METRPLLSILIPTTKERRERLRLCVESIVETCENVPHMLTTYENSLGGCVAPNIIMARNTSGFILVLNDDMIAQPGAIEMLYNKLVENPDCLVYPQDCIQNGAIATIMCCHRDFFLKHYHDGYIHNYADTELTLVARKLNKAIYVPEAVIQHMHWGQGLSVRDNTYNLQRNSKGKDKELYFARKAAGFPVSAAASPSA